MPWRTAWAAAACRSPSRLAISRSPATCTTSWPSWRPSCWPSQPRRRCSRDASSTPTCAGASSRSPVTTVAPRSAGRRWIWTRRGTRPWWGTGSSACTSLATTPSRATSTPATPPTPTRAAPSRKGPSAQGMPWRSTTMSSVPSTKKPETCFWRAVSMTSWPTTLPIFLHATRWSSSKVPSRKLTTRSRRSILSPFRAPIGRR
mmetsp:Transcript_1414/g.6174  ORF Transcript_1414/g.6174 Transcript_1414/m.6174 type:complete len:203 (+) Transcript_1414:949-1557(+)